MELRLERMDGEAALTLSAAAAEAGQPVALADVQRLQAWLAESGVTLRADPGAQSWRLSMPLRPVREAAPLVRATTGTATEVEGPPLGPHALRGLRVMVLDDDEPTREVVTEALEELGAEATPFGHGRDLLAVLERIGASEWPHGLICDIALDEEDGYTVLRDVRRLESLREIPLPQRMTAIALSGHAQPQDRIRAMMAGFQLHLSKPVQMGELVAAIRAHTHRADPAGR